jgi:hypothetical protein
MFRPFSVCAIIRLRLEYRRHLISTSIESHNEDDATKVYIRRQAVYV